MRHRNWRSRRFGTHGANITDAACTHLLRRLETGARQLSICRLKAWICRLNGHASVDGSKKRRAARQLLIRRLKTYVGQLNSHTTCLLKKSTIWNSTCKCKSVDCVRTTRRQLLLYCSKIFYWPTLCSRGADIDEVDDLELVVQASM